MDLLEVATYLSEAELLSYVFQMRCHGFCTLFKVGQLILQPYFFVLHLLQLFES